MLIWVSVVFVLCSFYLVWWLFFFSGVVVFGGFWFGFLFCVLVLWGGFCFGHGVVLSGLCCFLVCFGSLVFCSLFCFGCRGVRVVCNFFFFLFGFLLFFRGGTAGL